jgi:hypothetical protein
LLADGFGIFFPFARTFDFFAFPMRRSYPLDVRAHKALGFERPTDVAARRRAGESARLGGRRAGLPCRLVLPPRTIATSNLAQWASWR